MVTDDQGRPVSDLTPADFVIREGGQEREITHVSYVRLALPPASGATEPAPAPGTEAAPSPGAEPALAPRVRGRMITIVVDDLNVSFEGLFRLRDALHQYIDTRLAPGDRAAILRTGGGVSVMEQFTSDTARLHAAVDGLRYNYEGMAGVGGPAAIDSQMPFRGPSGRQNSEHGKGLEALRREMVEVGTLGALRRIVKGLAPFPGRKPVIVFSEGFKIDRRDGLTEPYIRDLTDEANRASVALYTINARGLETDAPQAGDNVTYLGSDVVIGGADIIRGIPRSPRSRAVRRRGGPLVPGRPHGRPHGQALERSRARARPRPRRPGGLLPHRLHAAGFVLRDCGRTAALPQDPGFRPPARAARALPRGLLRRARRRRRGNRVTRRAAGRGPGLALRRPRPRAPPAGPVRRRREGGPDAARDAPDRRPRPHVRGEARRRLAGRARRGRRHLRVRRRRGPQGPDLHRRHPGRRAAGPRHRVLLHGRPAGHEAGAVPVPRRGAGHRHRAAGRGGRGGGRPRSQGGLARPLRHPRARLGRPGSDGRDRTARRRSSGG